MQYIIAASTETGPDKAVNQDGFAVSKADTSNGEILFAVLCDGMGGLVEGERASATLINNFTEWFNANADSLIQPSIESRELRLQWEAVIDRTNQELLDYGKHIGSQVGTTVVALLLDGKNYYVINVGDSRLYTINSNYLKQITVDHSLVKREVMLGNITEEESRHDSRRNILLQGVGAKKDVIPDYYVGNIYKDEIFFMCSDGFYHELSEDELLSYLNPMQINNQSNMESSLKDMMGVIRDRGEKDDISIVAFKTIS